MSAREYQDRGMAKWMGFFLSEHSSSLWEEKNKEDLINVLHKDTLYVSYRLGHADKSTTLNTYSHWYYSGDSTISEEITSSLDNLGLSIYLPNSCQS